MERRAGEYTAELPDATRTSATEEAARPVAGPSSGAAPRAEQRIIRWDRFLPWRFLRVLLVEHDDSTRQIVTVLLRKCSYQGFSLSLSLSLTHTDHTRTDRHTHTSTILFVRRSMEPIGIVMGSKVSRTHQKFE